MKDETTYSGAELIDALRHSASRADVSLTTSRDEPLAEPDVVVPMVAERQLRSRRANLRRIALVLSTSAAAVLAGAVAFAVVRDGRPNGHTAAGPTASSPAAVVLDAQNGITFQSTPTEAAPLSFSEVYQAAEKRNGGSRTAPPDFVTVQLGRLTNASGLTSDSELVWAMNWHQCEAIVYHDGTSKDLCDTWEFFDATTGAELQTLHLP